MTALPSPLKFGGSKYLAFTVPGKPAPQGSKRAFVSPKSGRAHVVENSKRVAPWRDTVSYNAVRAMADAGYRELFHDIPIRVKVEFILPRPSGTPKTRPTPPATKKNADIDKLLRALLDALTDTVISDDCLVIESWTHKRIAEIGEASGAIITVEEMPWPTTK